MHDTSQALVNSLEKEDNENDGNDSSNGQKEGTHMLKEDILTEDVLDDNEITDKLAAENKELYVSFLQNVSSSINGLWLISILNLLKFHRIW